MESAKKQLRMICYFMAASIVMYAGLAWWLPSSATFKPILFRALSIMAVSLLVIIFAMRRILVAPAEAALAALPDDPRMLMRWRQGQIATYGLCEAIALYGLVLHFMGGGLVRVAPFFVAGLVLMLFFAPRTAAQREFPPAAGPPAA